MSATYSKEKKINLKSRTLRLVILSVTKPVNSRPKRSSIAYLFITYSYQKKINFYTSQAAEHLGS